MRKLFDFHGGIHPPERKHPSADAPITAAGVPPVLVLPLSQHIGAPATPVVAPGESVLKGQLIAAATGPVSAAVHASSSGRVAAIEQRQVPHPSGLTAPCVVIETDGRDEWTDHRGCADFTQIKPVDLIGIIRDAGIAGMGGAGFPTAIKLSPQAARPIHTLILNGTECEPYITADDRLMRERAALIVAGTRILQHVVDPQTTLIGIEDNKPEALAAMREAAASADMEVVEFPTKYPSGGEKQLIEILTGKQVPSGGLPADIGILCQNMGTAVAIHDAVVLGRPLISRITTVTGEAVARPGNYEVLLGTPMDYLLARAGYDRTRNKRLIMGGPMMGFTVPDPGVPVVKTTNCLLAPTDAELPAPPPPQACIRCGLCAEACPASLLPQQLFWFAQAKEYEKLEVHNLFDCIECGACSWVCPSNIPLVQYYRASKAEILRLRADNERAEHSRLRFEARQQRLEREAAEKEARRLARKQAAEKRSQQQAADGAGAEDPVQAAIKRAQAKKAAQSQGAPGGESEEQERLEKAVASAEKRLATATARLKQAEADGADTVDALRTGVNKTRQKLEQAREALRNHPFFQGSESAAPENSGDPAQDAIARAIAARQADSEMDPDEQARIQLIKLEQRLAASRDRLEAARVAGEAEKIIDALAASVERLEVKVATAKQAQQTEVS